MSNLQGTVVFGSVVPYSTQDIYSTHQAIYGKGGFRTVYGLNERNNIPFDRREDLMMVAVEDNSINYSTAGVAFYILDINNNNSTSSSLLDNNNWVLMNFGYGADGWVLPPPPQSFYKGNTGQRSYDGNYIYLCIAPNQWKRVEVDFFVNSGSSGFMGTSGLNFGDVPVWGLDNSWDYEFLVKDISSIGTTSGKLLITFSNNNTKIIDLTEVFSSTSSYANGSVPIWDTTRDSWRYNKTIESIFTYNDKKLNVEYTNGQSTSFNINVDELKNLSDVQLNNATSGDVLVYNGSKWVNEIFQDVIWTLPPPLLSTSTGKKGDLSYDDNFIYICIENNSWKRINVDYFVFSGSTSGGFSLPLGSIPVWNGHDYTTTIGVTNIISTIHNGEYGEKITYSNGTTSFIPFGTSGVNIILNLNDLTDVNVNVNGSHGIGNVLEWDGSKWVNVAISNSSTAGNGLTINSTIIELGGKLDHYTNINLKNNTLEIGNGIIYMPVTLNQGILLDGINVYNNEIVNNTEGIIQFFNSTSGLQPSTLIQTGGRLKIFDNTANEYVFFDGSNGGLKYGNDYSSFYLDRSLVDKGYVDNFLSASNGIVNINNNLQLGGGLNQDTSINGNGHNLILGGSVLNKLNSFSVYAQAFSFTSTSFMSTFGSTITNNNSAVLTAYNGANSSVINVSSGSNIISTGNATQTSIITTSPNVISNRTHNGTFIINTKSDSTSTNDAELFTTNITTPRSFQFPNKSGTIALLSDVIFSTAGALLSSAGNGLSISLTGVVELGGVLTQNTVVDGSNFNLGLYSNNGNINIKSVGSGNVIINNLTYPKLDGSNGFVLTTNGSGILSLQNPSPMLFVQMVTQTLIGNGSSHSEISMLSSSSGNVGSKTISANTLKVGDIVKLKTRGFINMSTSGSFTFNVKMGSTILSSRSSVLISNPKTNQLIDMDFEFIVRATGSSGKIIGNGLLTISTGNVATPTIAEFVMTSDATINTTISQILDFTVSWVSGFTGNLNTTTAFIRKEKNLNN